MKTRWRNDAVAPASMNPPEEVVPPGLEGLEADVWRALSQVIDPEIRKPITSLDMVNEITVTDAGAATVGVKLTIVGCPASRKIESDVAAAVAAVPGITEVAVDIAVMSRTERTALTEKLHGAKRSTQFGPDSPTAIYAITSGKGGVGKSTITANLAVALAEKGLAVGILDADVFGFSIPGILGLVTDGVAAKPTRVGDMILPPISYEVKVISIGMFLGPSTGSGTGGAVAWRGPMLHRTISQFLTDVYFGELDILLLDLPPGTGDIAISVGQLLPHAKVIVVTTPQPAAADVAERSGIVARQTGQSVLGVVENMAGLVQPDGSVLDLFGSGGGAAAAERLGVPVLASVPLSVALRVGGDAGAPVVLTHPDDPASVAIRELADRLARR